MRDGVEVERLTSNGTTIDEIEAAVGACSTARRQSDRRCRSTCGRQRDETRTRPKTEGGETTDAA
jgi:hypothetical protein